MKIDTPYPTKNADISPPNSALRPSICSSSRKGWSAMISDTLVLSNCPIIHHNNKPGATSSQRHVRTRCPKPVPPPSCGMIFSLLLAKLPAVKIPESVGAHYIRGETRPVAPEAKRKGFLFLEAV